MSTDGWQLNEGTEFSEADLAALRDLAQRWPTLTPAEQQGQLAALRARYPDLELTADDVAMIRTRIDEMRASSPGEA